MNVPNLDAMDETELMAFWSKHQNGRKRSELFPAGGKGTKTVTVHLANYASNKATAMGCRHRGSVNAAMLYEAICERIYNALPKEARW